MGGLETINGKRIPNEFIALWQDIRGLQDLRDFTAKDLHVLFQDIRGLQKQLQNAKGDLQRTNLQDVGANLEDAESREDVYCHVKMRSLKTKVQGTIEKVQTTSCQ